MGWRVVACASIALALAADAAERGADGRFDVRRSAHFVLHQDVDIDVRTGPRGARRFERDVLEVLESGHARLDALLGLRPPRRIDVLVYDPGVFDAYFAGRFPFPAAGFYQGVIRVRGNVALSASLAATLHHELVHAALDAAAPSLLLPAWLNEGLAEWFEARALGVRGLSAGQVAALRDAAARGALAPLASLETPSFAALPADMAGLAYLQSRALLEEVERRGGRSAVRVLVSHVLRSGDVDRALARAAGLDRNGLETSLARTLGVVPAGWR